MTTATQVSLYHILWIIRSHMSCDLSHMTARSFDGNNCTLVNWVSSKLSTNMVGYEGSLNAHSTVEFRVQSPNAVALCLCPGDLT